MNYINIIVNLCDEDRARLDKIIEGLAAIGKRPDCPACVEGVAGYMDEAAKDLNSKNDDIAQMLKKVLHMTDEESPENAPGAPENLDHPTLDPFPETPTAAEEPSKAGEKEEKIIVTMAMLTNKALTLSANGKKDQVKEIVHVYAPKVTALPEDKWAEVYTKLCALEG